jgi:hypothetical protein
MLAPEWMTEHAAPTRQGYADYVPDAGDRTAFASWLRASDAVWIANEGPDIIPGVPEALVGEHPDKDASLLCIDGTPTAWTDGHGTWIDWRPLPVRGVESS